MNEIQLEKVEFEPGKSFKLFSPRLRNTFLWHYHPEFELLYVEADAGIRHVGTHISTYTQSDLVFIGGDLPHLNFDYRLNCYYHQVVIQLRTDFLGTALGLVPEFALIRQLFKAAEYGIAFSGETKRLAAEKLKQLGKLNSLEQLLELISILQLLAGSVETEVLNNDLSSRNFILKDKVRMGAIYEYVDANFHKKPDIHILAQRLNLTIPAFCRYFKQQTNMKFTDFVNQYRIERAKNLLIQNHNVTEAAYAAGFGSIHYFSNVFKKVTGDTPSDFKNRWQNKMI